MKRISHFLLLTFLFTSLCFLYFYPASLTWMKGEMMGGREDDQTMPFFYWLTKEVWLHRPTGFLSGAFFTDQVGSPFGQAVWITYIERFSALFYGFFLDVDQIAVFFSSTLLVLSGLLCFNFAKKVGLSTASSIFFSIAFTFTPFTLYRSQVHHALASVYFLPLLALFSLKLFSAAKSKDFFIASLLLLLTVSAAQYFVFITLTLLPFLLWLAFKKTTLSKKTFLVKSAITLLPFFMSLAFIKQGPIFGFDDLKKEASKETSYAPKNPHSSWDLLVYSSRAIDYLGGNLDPRALELNFLRGLVNQKIEKQNEGSFYRHERSAGIRWFILVFAALAFLKRRKWIDTEEQKVAFTLGVIFIGVGFIFSLSPRALAPLGHGVMPSQLIHALFPQMRAPNRWSVATQFGACLIAFLFLDAHLKKCSFKQKSLHVLAYAILLILELPPTLHTPSYRPEAPLNRSAACGSGMHLPYFPPGVQTGYGFINSLRKTDCKVFDSQQLPHFNQQFERYFGEKTFFGPPIASVRVSQKIELERLKVEWLNVSGTLFEREPEICQKLGFVKRHEFCERSAASFNQPL